MGLLATYARSFLKPIPIVVAVVLISGTLALHAVFDNLKNRASLLAGSLTGMKCLISSVGPCFPCGIKASGVSMCTPSGEPLFQAKELRAQVNLLRYLQGNGKRSDLFDTIHGEGIRLTLLRNERGEWELPRLPISQEIRRSQHDGSASRRRFFFTNVTMVVKTANGESERLYKSLVADVDPRRGAVTLKIAGTGESATILFTKGSVKWYELRADNFSPALLAPVSAFPLPLENLAMNGSLRAVTSDDKNFAIEAGGTMTARGLRLPVLSSRAIDFRLPFDLKGNLSKTGIDDLTARISLAGETVVVRGDILGWHKPVIDVTTTFFDFSYDRATAALPPSLHPGLPVIRLAGSMTGTFRLHLDLANPDSLDYRYTGRADRVEVLSLGPEIDMERLKGPFVHQVRMRPGSHVSILLSPDNPDFTPYRRIPHSLRTAVLAAEDLGFFSHRGFSKRHIRGSLIENLKAGRVVRGASTISMQLAKNLFLSPERSMSRKLEEALITLALEQHLDKKRILEIYLNIIEWGEGIYGIDPAARYYFGKRPEELSPVESAFLASIIARPRNWRPDPLPSLGEGWREYLRVILCKMYKKGAADVESLLEAGVSLERIERLTEKDFGPVPADTPEVTPDMLPPFPDYLLPEGRPTESPMFLWSEHPLPR